GKAGKERTNASSQAQPEPGRRTQHDQQADNSNRNRRRCAMPVKPGGEPVEDRVEGNRNDDAPDNDRQKWPDQNQGPIAQESEANNSNCQDYERIVPRTKRR